MTISTEWSRRIRSSEFVGATQEPQNATDMALDRGYLFQPKRHPILLPNGEPETDRKGNPLAYVIYRDMPDGSQKMLNPAVSPTFALSGYELLTQTVDGLFPESTVGMNMLEGGRRIMIRVRPEEPVAVYGDDRVAMEILFVQALDGGWSTAAYGTTYRFFCSNQMRIEQAVFRVKRTTNHDQNVFERSLIMATATEQFQEYMARARHWAHTPFLRQHFVNLIKELVPRPVAKDGKEPSSKTLTLWERKVDGIDYFWNEEVDRCGATAWAALQAIQSYEFHTKGRDKSADADLKRKAEILRDPQKHERLTRRAMRLLPVG